MLDIADVIDVSIQASAPGLAIPQINSVALLTRQAAPGSWGALTEKIYRNSGDVLTDWGSSSPVYKIAVNVFAQQPGLLTTGGYLVVIPVLPTVTVKASETIQELTFTAKTGGTAGNGITIIFTSGATKGAEAVSVISSAITVQIATGVSIAAEIKEAIDNYPAAAALVSVALTPGHETDTQIAFTPAQALTGGLDASSEAFEDTIARMANGTFFYGVLVDVILSGPELANLATYMQTVNKVLFYASRTAADFAPGGMLDLLRSRSQYNTRGLYYYGADAIDTQEFAAAYAGRALSTDFSGVNTTQTMELKTLANVDPDATIDETAYAAAQAAGVDVYSEVGNAPSLFTSGENLFFDQVYNRAWLQSELQTELFNAIRGTSTKIAQTEEGVELLKSIVRGVLAQAVANGMVAPGTWDAETTFGNAADLIRCITDAGYYVWTLPLSQQSQADKDARKSPLIQAAMNEAGAIHSASLVVNVNA